MIVEVTNRLAELHELCRRFGVRRLDLFGSAVTGKVTAESDLDFLVEFEHETPPGYADRYFGLLEALHALFGRPIDVVVASAVTNPYFEQSVARNKVPLYAA